MNGGKGAAVLDGLREAGKEGFRHALVMDADGQHPADRIVEFMNLAHAHERTLILGVPAFGPDAPKARVYGRLGGNTFTEIATLWGGIRDSLFGFRVYPVAETVAVMDRIKTARRYDFDTEVAVRLYWEGFRTINIAVPVLYPRGKRAASPTSITCGTTSSSSAPTRGSSSACCGGSRGS